MSIYVTCFLLPRHAKTINHLTRAFSIHNAFGRAYVCMKHLLYMPTSPPFAMFPTVYPIALIYI
jgi:hypothetical protein